MCRQRDDLIEATAEERIVVDKKRIGPLLDERCERSIEVAVAAGSQHTNLPPEGASRRLQAFRLGLGNRIGWVDQIGDHSGHGHQFVQQLQPLWSQLAEEIAYAR